MIAPAIVRPREKRGERGACANPRAAFCWMSARRVSSYCTVLETKGDKVKQLYLVPASRSCTKQHIYRVWLR